MLENKKQNVSIRMNVSDLRKIKDIARRLNVRESDVFRYAIKSSLAKLAPLHDWEVTGSDLLPVFIECGTEIANYFDLDVAQLDSLINGNGEDAEKCVDRDDLDLLVMLARHEQYVFQKLKASVDNPENSGALSLLKRHLYEKYVAGNRAEKIESGSEQTFKRHVERQYKTQ
jgi:hypothetical protein